MPCRATGAIPNDGQQVAATRSGRGTGHTKLLKRQRQWQRRRLRNRARNAWQAQCVRVYECMGGGGGRSGTRTVLGMVQVSMPWRGVAWALCRPNASTPSTHIFCAPLPYSSPPPSVSTPQTET